jgi:hypothetical protein
MLPTKIPKDLELLNGTPLFSPVPEIKNKLNTYGYITTLKQCPVAQSKMFFTDEIDLLPQAWWDHAKNIPVTVYISKDLIRLHSAPNKHKDFPLKKETLDKYNGCSVMMPRMIIIDNDNANTHNIAPLHITIDNTPIQQAQTNTQPTQARPKIRQQQR